MTINFFIPDFLLGFCAGGIVVTLFWFFGLAFIFGGKKTKKQD